MYVKQSTYLILKSRGLLLKPRGFEVVHDIGDSPVGRVWHLTVLHRTVESAENESKPSPMRTILTMIKSVQDDDTSWCQQTHLPCRPLRLKKQNKKQKNPPQLTDVKCVKKKHF